jgi:copper resistance protein B
MDRNTRKRKMNMTLNALSLALAFAGMSALPAVAQTMGATSTMDHSMMDHGSMQAPPTESPAEAMPGMDHGSSTQAQGGTASAEARDPHAYSDGYTLDSGLYALPGTRQLRLADEHNFGSVLFNRLERGFGDTSSSTAYDTQAWFGRDYDRLVIKAEGDVARGKLQEARTEVLWGHAIAPFWDAQLGLRNDSGGTAPERTWLALGVQGLAPYWFGVDAATYVGDNGRIALRLSGEYEILLTQKLILQPRVELNFYGQDDVAREIGSGLANGVAGLRLRYEINRQFAPYLGVERSNKFGNTADLVRASGAHQSRHLG